MPLFEVETESHIIITWAEDDAAFAEHALEQGCFSCIPGSAFGLPGAVRLSYGATTLDDIARLDGRLERLSRR